MHKMKNRNFFYKYLSVLLKKGPWILKCLFKLKKTTLFAYYGPIKVYKDRIKDNKEDIFKLNLKNFGIFLTEFSSA